MLSVNHRQSSFEIDEKRAEQLLLADNDHTFYMSKWERLFDVLRFILGFETKKDFLSRMYNDIHSRYGLFLSPYLTDEKKEYNKERNEFLTLKNFCPPHMHELFKCKIEFSDSVMTTTYFIGDKPVRTRQLIILQDPNGRFDFSRLNFEDTEFGESNFSNVNFNDANMKRATLMDCKLSGASFVRTDLTEAKGCADFSGCYMEYAILNGAQFENSSFKNATLFSCDVAGTNMSGVNFEYATIERGDFSTCILKNIVLREAKIIKMHTGSMRKFFFDDTPPLQDLIRVDICKAKEHIQKIYQIFEDISEDSMPEIKKILANELSTKNCIYDLAKLKKDVSEINCLAKYYTSNRPPEGLNDILQNDDINIFDNFILSLITVDCCISSSFLFNLSEERINYYLDRFTEQPTLMLSFSTAYVMMTDLALKSKNNILAEKAYNIYKTYLQHKDVKPYTEGNDYPDFSEWRKQQDHDDAWYVLFSAQQNNRAMRLSSNALNKMLDTTIKNKDWDHFYLYAAPEQVCSLADINLNTVLMTEFPVFSYPWKRSQHNILLKNYLKILQLGDLYEPFVTASQSCCSQTKMDGIDEQIKLNEIFAPLMKLIDNYSLQAQSIEGAGYEMLSKNKKIKQKKNVSELLKYKSCLNIKGNHYKDLMKACRMENANKTEQAMLLISFAVVFARYSSASSLGTEYNSPQILRVYSAALLLKAYELENSIVESEALDNWLTVLLGLGSGLNCTAILSKNIADYTRSHHIDKYLDSVAPKAWGL